MSYGLDEELTAIKLPEVSLINSSYLNQVMKKTVRSRMEALKAKESTEKATEMKKIWSLMKGSKLENKAFEARCLQLHPKAIRLNTNIDSELKPVRVSNLRAALPKEWTEDKFRAISNGTLHKKKKHKI